MKEDSTTHPQIFQKDKQFKKVFVKEWKQRKWLYLMLVLPLVSLIIWSYIPMYGILIAFQNFSPARGISGSPWVGLSHFQRFFNSFIFWDLIVNTLRLSIYGLLVGVPSSIILALMFNEVRNKKFKSIVQTISYFPNFISVVIVVSMFTFFLSTDGMINQILIYLGLEAPISFLGNASWFPHIFVWSGVWQGVGWGTLIYTAAMAGIPQDQYEAAVLDGSTRLQSIRYITIPGIMPTIVISTILAAGGIMSVGFERTFLFQNPGNIGTSEIIATFVYQAGLVNSDHSFATAIGVFNNIINLIIIVTVNAFARKFSETSLW